jgi:hypothetical protein
MKTLNQPQSKQEILQRIARLRPDLQRRWGRMNAGQMVCHLCDSFLCVMGEKPATVHLKFKARKLVKWCALYLPMHWPQGVATRPELDQEKDGTAPGDFEEDRRKLLGLIEKFTRLPREFRFHLHPIFLEMTEKQWMRWGYLHTDHHLRQFGV